MVIHIIFGYIKFILYKITKFYQKSMLINVYLDVLMCLRVSWGILWCPGVSRLTDNGPFVLIGVLHLSKTHYRDTLFVCRVMLVAILLSAVFPQINYFKELLIK